MNIIPNWANEILMNLYAKGKSDFAFNEKKAKFLIELLKGVGVSCRVNSDSINVVEAKEKIRELWKAEEEERADFVHCNNCHSTMFIQIGLDTCPQCGAKDSNEWMKEDEKEIVVSNVYVKGQVISE